MKVVLEDMPDFLRDFVLYLDAVKNFSKTTIEGYLTDLIIFFKFHRKMKENISDINIEEIDIKDLDISFVNAVTSDDIYTFIHYLRNERDNSPKTIARKIATLRSFFRYEFVINEKIEHNPTEKISSPKLEKTLPKYLTLEECNKLLEAIDGDFKERDYCIVVLFLNCGIRLSELVGINHSDIREDKLLVRGKGNKEREIYLNEVCLDAIEEYKKFKDDFYKDKDHDTRAVFLGIKGKRLHKRWVEAIVKKYVDSAGLFGRGYSPHKLRHTAATMMYQNGSDVRILKDILGHSNLGTTQIYTHTSDKQMEQAMKSNPIGKVKSKKASDT